MTWPAIAEGYLSDADRGYVLVSLVEKTGSSFLQPGARLLVRDDGSTWGGVSAGCLEERLADVALECLHSGNNRLLEVDTRPTYGCFGTLLLLFEVVTDRELGRHFFAGILNSLADRRPVAVLTPYKEPGKGLMTHVARTGDGFIQRIDPPARLYVIGSWPDGRALAELALALKWAVVLIDDIREGFNLERRLSSITPDNMTAVVVMTHNLARDCVCLRAVLSRSFGYIGVIGSHTRRTALIDQLADLHDLDLLESFERVYCPAGLNLGGDGPAAVALSVLAEIQSILNGQDASCLTERNGPIHEVRSAR